MTYKLYLAALYFVINCKSCVFNQITKIFCRYIDIIEDNSLFFHKFSCFVDSFSCNLALDVLKVVGVSWHPIMAEFVLAIKSFEVFYLLVTFTVVNNYSNIWSGFILLKQALVNFILYLTNLHVLLKFNSECMRILFWFPLTNIVVPLVDLKSNSDRDFLLIQISSRFSFFGNFVICEIEWFVVFLHCLCENQPLEFKHRSLIRSNNGHRLFKLFTSNLVLFDFFTILLAKVKENIYFLLTIRF